MPKISHEARLGVSFESAINLLADRSGEVLGGGLSMFGSEVFGLEVGHEVRVVPGELITVDQPIELAVLDFRVEADPGRGWFPVFEGALEVISTDDCGVSVALEGEYQPPGGVQGAVVDRVGLHRLADNAIDRFFQAAADRLRRGAAALDALSGVPV